MDNSVEDCVGEGAFPDFGMPALGAELWTEDSRTDLVANFDNLQYISGLGVRERQKQPLVQNQKAGFFVAFHGFDESTLAPGDSQLIEKVSAYVGGIRFFRK